MMPLPYGPALASFLDDVVTWGPSLADLAGSSPAEVAAILAWTRRIRCARGVVVTVPPPLVEWLVFPGWPQ